LRGHESPAEAINGVLLFGLSERRVQFPALLFSELNELGGLTS
jgi:hypothetical protein